MVERNGGYSRSEHEASPESELLKRITELRTFVRENPESELLPQLSDTIEDLLATEPKNEFEESESLTPNPVEELTVISGESEPDMSVSSELPSTSEVKLDLSLATFETARRTADPLSDELIAGALNGDLAKPGGPREFMVKSYLDNVPADASDKEFLKNHAEVIAQRDELSDFIAEELKITAPSTLQRYMDERKQKFLERLETGKGAFRRYVDGREKRLDLSINKVPGDALDFHGFLVDASNGGKIDLLENSMSNARANIFIQREIAGRFVHWSSGRYMERRTSGDKPKMTRRIYLNPRPQDSVGVFKAVIRALDDKGFAIKAKIYDRSSDSDVMKAYDTESDVFSVRGDGILVYATEEEAEAVLEVVQQKYIEHQGSFDGRGLSTIPFEVAPGFGIGDEPTSAGTSLTSHRADIIERVLKKVRESGIDGFEAQRQLFRQFWRTEAANANINPDNPAFNAR